jgi:ceramide glucosyltransferase
VLILLLYLLRWLSATAAAASIAYCLIATFAGMRFVRRRRVPSSSTDLPRVSILKPLKGDDPGMYAALRSHCVQDYPQYEILLGVTDAEDPAVPVVRRLMQEFPAPTIRLVFTEKRMGANGKVSSLIQLAEAANGEYLLVNDSDIRVETDYLKTVMGELRQPNVGMVTCLYRGLPGASVGSRLEALGINTDFVPGVLSADLLEGGLQFGLGSTLAFRRSDLKAAGGFEAIVDYLADDYELGNRIAKLGRKIELSRTIVETNLPMYDFAGFWAHQLRWARTIRASRPGGYTGLLLTYTLPWALATLLFSEGTRWAWELTGVAFLARMILALQTSRFVLGDKTWPSLLLFPVRDLVAVPVWFAGWLGSSIEWRGERFVLKDGKIIQRTNRLQP